ncbi:MAG TPA: bifunctional riboflavin kinase/FAD synthetase, partial [Saprospiraceae bacterium]|nr:bifunctional riboflavin kinase/FAD synthetase [Saprospiraceae bacterium]
MKVYRSLASLPSFEKSIVTIGSFDGVHYGHQKLIQRALTLAKELEQEDIVVTFHPHPRSIIYPKDNTLQLLNTIEEKINLFEKLGVSNLVIIPFTVEFSQQMPEEYVEHFLIKAFNPSHIIVGYDHRFGLNRQGDIYLLRAYEKKGFFTVLEVQKQEIEEIAVSSTKIRNAILEGNIREANLYLNNYYLIIGQVVKGDSIGEKIGYPTANVVPELKSKLIPNEGVYAVYVWIDETRYEGMLYIGKRPTIGEKLNQTIEVNIFDFSGSLYHDKLKVELVDFVREDKKFESLDELKNQLHIDKNSAQAILKKEKTKFQEKSICTIAVLNYNGQEYLEAYLSSLLYSSDADKVDLVVIDNNSSDESVDYIQEWHPEVEVIQLTKNYGYAEGYNRGISQIKTPYIAFVNSDVLVSEAWIDPIIQFMTEHADVVAMQPKIKSLENKDAFEYAGASGGYIDMLGYPFCRGRIFDTVEKDEGQYNDIREVFWTSGAAMVVRTDVFKKLGGFDKDYFAHMEEIDFCWRAKRAGYKCFVDGRTEIYHLGGGTLEYDNPKKVFLNFRNSLATIIKNEQKRYVALTFLARLVLDGVAGLKFLLEGKYKNTFAIIQAHFSIYNNIFNLWNKRANNSTLI